MIRSIVVRQVRQPRLRRRWLVALVVSPLSFLPLVGTLGYESGLLLSPLAAALGLAVGVDAVRAQREQAARGGVTARDEAGRATTGDDASPEVERGGALREAERDGASPEVERGGALREAERDEAGRATTGDD
ncbi:MAG: hypothetical protein KDK70_22630, partial [Myxococcales bacterium]|nr:hypothetical protein [Myxococcales bacterium]